MKCPQCGSDHVTYLAKNRIWKCYAKHPRPTFSLKTGTIFEDSPLALEKWLTVAWMIVSCKNGISSYEIHRGLKVTQKTAWFMLHRVRLAMQDGATRYATAVGASDVADGWREHRTGGGLALFAAQFLTWLF